MERDNVGKRRSKTQVRKNPNPEHPAIGCCPESLRGQLERLPSRLPDRAICELEVGLLARHGELRPALLSERKESGFFLLPEGLELLGIADQNPRHALLERLQKLGHGILLAAHFDRLALRIPNDGGVRFSGWNAVVIMLGDLRI